MPRAKNDDKAAAVVQDWSDYHELPIRTEWLARGLEHEQFYYGNQWTAAQLEQLKTNGNWPSVKNRLRAPANHLISEFASKAPQGKVVATSGEDINVDVVFNAIIKHIEYISNRPIQIARIAKEVVIKGGIGWLVPVIDKLSSNGEGDIYIRQIPNEQVHVSPTVRDIPSCKDAPAIIIGTEIPLSHALKLYGDKPEIRKRIESGEATNFDSQPQYSKQRDIEGKSLLIGTQRQLMDQKEDFETVFKIEKHEAVVRKRWQVINKRTGQTYETYDENLTMLENAGIFMQIMEKKRLPDVIRQKVSHVIAPDIWLGETYFETENYLPVPFVAEDTGNLFPVDMIHFALDEQRMLNKHESMRIRYIQEATHGKLIINKDADDVDKDTIRENWAKLGHPIEIEFGQDGEKPFENFQPSMIPSAYVLDAQRAEQGIFDAMGVNPLELGDPQGAPRTFRGTISIRESSKSKRRNTIDLFNASLQQFYDNLIQLIPSVYTAERSIVFLDEDHVPVELKLNKTQFIQQQWQKISTVVRGSAENKEQFQLVGDISKIKAQYRIITDSFLPNDRFAMAQLMSEVLQQSGGNNVFLKEMIKFLDLPNRAQLIKEIDENSQLKGMVKQQQEMMKALKIDAEKSRREKENALINMDVVKAGAQVDIAKMKQVYDLEQTVDEFEKDKEVALVKFETELEEIKNNYSLALAKRALQGKN